MNSGNASWPRQIYVWREEKDGDRAGGGWHEFEAQSSPSVIYYEQYEVEAQERELRDRLTKERDGWESAAKEYKRQLYLIKASGEAPVAEPDWRDARVELPLETGLFLLCRQDQAGGPPCFDVGMFYADDNVFEVVQSWLVVRFWAPIHEREEWNRSGW